MQRGKCSILSVVAALIIVVVVASVLLSISARERENARSGKCLNNLKCCTQALKMYSDDYNGLMPSSCLVNHSKKWNAADAVVFCTILGKRPVSPGERGRTWPELLCDETGSPDVMRCPSEWTEGSDPKAQASYYYKLANDKAWYGIDCDAPRRSMRDYGYESDQIAFYEHLGLHCDDKSGLKNGVRINVSFIDTHVATIVIKNATSGDPLNCAVAKGGEPMYYNTHVDEQSGKTHRDHGPARHTDPTTCYDDL